MKVLFHSITDLITNSSTVIYTYSDASADACREMIDEIFKLSGIDKKCDDVFVLSVLIDDTDEYETYYYDKNDDDDWDDDDDDDDDEPKEKKERPEVNVKKIVKDVINGKIPKPEWMVEAENKEAGDGYPPETTLHIVAKLPEYEKLAKLVISFLYSTGHESSYG